MVQDRLAKAVSCRLKELGLPPSLIDLDEFRHNFLVNGWVMFVRDRDKMADVHLVQPHQGVKPPASQVPGESGKPPKRER